MRRRGFTLLEGLIVSLLILLMLGVMGGIVSRYLQVGRHLQQHDESREALVLATQLLKLDSQSAVKFLLPAATDLSVSSVLRMELLDSTVKRLPEPWPLTPPASFFPHAPVIVVEYRVDHDRQLLRESSGSVTEVVSVVSGIQGFSVRHLETRSLEIQLSLLSGERLVNLTHRCYLPLGRR